MDNILEILSQIRPEYNFSESNDFIRDGLLDSLDIVILVTSLEERFGISIDGAEVKPENFSNLETLETFIHNQMERKSH